MNNHASGSLLGVLGIFTAAILWGTTGTAATFAPQVSGLAIGAVAMGLGGLLQAFLAFDGIYHSIDKLRQNWPYLLAGALGVMIYPLAFYSSMKLAGVTIGTVISLGTAPLFAALIELVMDKTRLQPRWLIGAGIGLCGMVLLCLSEGHIEAGAASDHATLKGIALGLIAGFTYSLYSWTARRMMQNGLKARVSMGATFGLGALFLMPVLLLTGGPLLASWNNALVGLYMATVPMFAGYVCFGYGLSRVSASMATTITLFEPVVAAILAVIIVGERLPLIGWIGITLIVACLFVICLPVKPHPKH